MVSNRVLAQMSAKSLGQTRSQSMVQQKGRDLKDTHNAIVKPTLPVATITPQADPVIVVAPQANPASESTSKANPASEPASKANPVSKPDPKGSSVKS